MKYVGSKNRISKYLAPIIQSYVDNPLCQGYIEPFVGGANMIDKIKCRQGQNKVGCDINDYLIALLMKARDDCENIPDTIQKFVYDAVKSNPEKYEDWLVGLVGFCASYDGKFFGGYANNVHTKIGIVRNYTDESIKNLKKQAPNLKGTNFWHKDFRNLNDKMCGYVIYCDPPYRGTTKYAEKDFPYEEFYEWCRKMAKNNIVLISEYWMPNDFKCIWQGELKCTLDKSSRTDRVEKLFICGGNADA